MRIFLSSVIRGLEAYRDAAARAARALRHEVKRAEDFAASSATPQQACLAGVRWAEAVILLLGDRYGDRQASGISPTHEEYREARERCPVLIFVERGAAYEPAQHEFLREVQGWTTGHYTAPFSDADELRDAVTSALRDLELAQATGPVDEGEMRVRAQTLLPDLRNHAQGVTLTLVVAGGPRQQVLRPRELEAPALEEDLSREALFGAFRVLDRAAGTRHAIRENALVIEQEKASILIDQLGTVRLVFPGERPRTRGDFASVSVAIREDVEELLQQALRFVAWVLDRIDPIRRISDVVPVVNLSGALGWRTRAEHERSPNSFTMRMSQEPATVSLTPARRHRAALSQDAQAVAEVSPRSSRERCGHDGRGPEGALSKLCRKSGKGSRVTETLTWRARLRFRLQKKIRIDGKEHRLQVAGREVVLTPPTPDLKIYGQRVAHHECARLRQRG